MHRNRFGALAVAAAAALFLFSALPGSAVPVIAQQAPWYVATGQDGTLYLVTQDGYYEITPGTLSDDQIASFRDLGPTGSVGPNGGLGPAAPTGAAAPPSAPPAAPPPPATVKPGDVMYQSDWSQGMNGWTGSSGWKTVSSMLVNSGGGDGTAWSPFQPSSPDYAVEAQLQRVGDTAGGDWGIVVRGDPSTGHDSTYGGGIQGGNVASISTGFASRLAVKDFTPRNDWHQYRLEAKGNHLKLLIDGSLVLELDDNRFLTGTGIGLYSNGQVSARSFKVIAL